MVDVGRAMIIDFPTARDCYHHGVCAPAPNPAKRPHPSPLRLSPAVGNGAAGWARLVLAGALAVTGSLIHDGADAEEVVLRCAPTLIDAPGALDWSVTGVTQAADDDDADPDATGSFDLVAHRRHGGGLWMMQVEGSTGENSGRVSGQFPLSNGDAATAVDEDGDGRAQLSQVNYTRKAETYAFAAGLVDPTCYLDLSQFANDETRAFLAAPFINNLSIAFPDYTLGGGLHLHREAGLEATIFVSSSNGLGDNDDASYSNLVDITDSGKGVFAAAELVREGERTYRFGVWANTRDFENLANPDGTGSNYGLYGLIEGTSRTLDWNVRAGAANPEVSEIALFAALATEFPLGRATAGLAVSYLRGSGDLPSESSNAVFAEASIHIDVGEHLRVTPLVQWTHNDSFTSRDALIAGLRATYFRAH